MPMLKSPKPVNTIHLEASSLPTYDGGRFQHSLVAEVVDNVDLEIITLQQSVNDSHMSQTQYVHTLFPEMRGPGKTPFMTTAARVYPSGVMSALEMVRSVTGPIAPRTT